MADSTSALGFYPGELILMGMSGKLASASTLQTIKSENVSQLILFSHNYESPEQLIDLTDSLQNHSPDALPILVSADQEGGRVQRFIAGFTRLPSAKKIGDRNLPSLTFELAKIQARELFAAGIQLNFAPDSDINTNPQNPVIGDRAFGDHEDRVTRMVTASVRGHLQEGVHPCIKHFPGHGDTHLDSHFALPSVTTPLDLLRTREWIPFHKAMRSGCQFLMSAHVLLPHLDPKFPGTLSKTFLQTYLRQELQYRGIIVSDDMEMHAITHHYGAQEAPLLALEAGCDLLCYRSEEQALIALESIKKALESGRLSAERLRQSAMRIREVRKGIQLAKNKLSKVQRLSLIGSEEHAASAAQFL